MSAPDPEQVVLAARFNGSISSASRADATVMVDGRSYDAPGVLADKDTVYGVWLVHGGFMRDVANGRVLSVKVGEKIVKVGLFGVATGLVQLDQCRHALTAGNPPPASPSVAPSPNH
jgi:hypothetical protein